MYKRQLLLYTHTHTHHFTRCVYHVSANISPFNKNAHLENRSGINDYKITRFMITLEDQDNLEAVNRENSIAEIPAQ